MDKPTPCFGVNVRALCDPAESDNGDSKAGPSLVRMLFDCRHCRHVRSDASFGCLTEQYKNEFEACVDIMRADTQDSKRCRQLMYYHTALICLVPFANRDRKALPGCVVRKVHASFPDPDGLHVTAEHKIIFYRERSEETRVYMVIRSKPRQFPFAG